MCHFLKFVIPESERGAKFLYIFKAVEFIDVLLNIYVQFVLKNQNGCCTSPLKSPGTLAEF